MSLCARVCVIDQHTLCSLRGVFYARKVMPLPPLSHIFQPDCGIVEPVSRR